VAKGRKGSVLHSWISELGPPPQPYERASAPGGQGTKKSPVQVCVF
jgi:hypothetical protein